MSQKKSRRKCSLYTPHSLTSRWQNKFFALDAPSGHLVHFISISRTFLPDHDEFYTAYLIFVKKVSDVNPAA